MAPISEPFKPGTEHLVGGPVLDGGMVGAAPVSIPAGESGGLY